MSGFVEPAIGSGEGTQPYRFLDTLSYIRVPGEATEGEVSVVEMHLREGHAPPMHVHEAAHETIHVVDGTVAVHVDETEQSVAARSSVVLPKGEPHSLVAREQATILASTAPAGFDEFVRAAGEPVDETTVPDTPPSEDEIGRVSAVADEYGIGIVGQPPGAS